MVAPVVILKIRKKFPKVLKDKKNVRSGKDLAVSVEGSEKRNDLVLRKGDADQSHEVHKSSILMQ